MSKRLKLSEISAVFDDISSDGSDLSDVKEDGADFGDFYFWEHGAEEDVVGIYDLEDGNMDCNEQQIDCDEGEAEKDCDEGEAGKDCDEGELEKDCDEEANDVIDDDGCSSVVLTLLQIVPIPTL